MGLPDCSNRKMSVVNICQLVESLSLSVISSVPGKISILQCVVSCLTLCDPMGCSRPGFSVYGSFLTRILEWVVISFSRACSWFRVWNCVSYSSYIGRWILLPLSHLGSWENFYSFSINIYVSSLITFSIYRDLKANPNNLTSLVWFVACSVRLNSQKRSKKKC